MDDMKRNGDGYKDPTAYKAFQKITKDRKVLARKVLLTVFNVTHLANFDVPEIRIRDNITGEELYRRS